MNRRDFLLLKVRAEPRSVALSCEEFYMRFLDSRLDGSTPDLLRRLAAELWRAETVHLVDELWLADEEFKQALDPVLAAFRARGGHVVTSATTAPPQAVPPQPR